MSRYNKPRYNPRGLRAGGGGALGTLFLDNFTDAQSVTLPAHLPNIDINTPGNSWNDVQFTIDAFNRAEQIVSGGADVTSHIDVEVADYVYTAVFPLWATSSNDPYVEFRKTDGANRWRLLRAAGELRLQDVVATVITTRAFTAYAAVDGELCTMIITCNGDDITGRLINGSNDLTVNFTSSFNNTATLLGFRLGNTAGNVVDNVQVQV